MCICIDNKSCLKENLTYLLPSVRATLLITVCLEIPCIRMSKRFPKKPHSFQSDISMFRMQHWQLPIITHMVLFNLTMEKSQRPLDVKKLNLKISLLLLWSLPINYICLLYLTHMNMRVTHSLRTQVIFSESLLHIFYDRRTWTV